MQVFLIALSAVAVLLVTAVPGFLLVRTKKVREETIADLSKILLFVASPCLSVYSFTSATYSKEKLVGLGIFALLCILVHAVMFGVGFLMFGKKHKDAVYRVLTLACVFGNCAFFGVPIIEALLPDISPDIIVYTTIYALIMNVLGWTVGSAILTHDAKYISVKKIFLNPATLGAAVGFIFFVFGIRLPADLSSMVTIVGRMSTPLSMLIMGMRLATVRREEGLFDKNLFYALSVKLLLMPLLTFLIVFRLPVALEIRQTMFITAACPVASIVLNFSEMLGTGQKEAARLVLFGTALSILTLPLVMLLLPFMG